MPMKTFLVAAFLLIGFGLLNQSAYRVMETEKAILLEFGNLIDAEIEPGLHFKLPIAQEVKKFDARVLTLDSQGETYYTLEKKTANCRFLRKVAGGGYRAFLYRHIV